MPDPKRLLNTIRQAISAFRETPGRKGHLVHLDGSGDVLVAGDLHGNLENFRRLLERAELKSHPNRHLIFQELVHSSFPYQTGGDKSHQALDLLAALKCQFPRQVHMLLGNHELAQWTNQWIAKGETELNAWFREGVETAYGAHADKIYEAYVDLLAVIPVAIRTSNRVFISHSLPLEAQMEEFDPEVLTLDEHRPADLLPGGVIHSLVWGRDTATATVTAFLQKVDADWLITGHIPCEQGFATPNERQLILDCMRDPAAYCLFLTDRPVTIEDLVDGVKTL